MLDYFKQEISIGDWIHGVGYVPYGKVTKIENNSITIELNGEVETFDTDAITNYGIIIAEYSSIRNRHLRKELPENFYSCLLPVEKVGCKEYAYLGYFEELLSDAITEASDYKIFNTRLLMARSDFKETVKSLLTEHNDETDFLDAFEAYVKKSLSKM